MKITSQQVRREIGALWPNLQYVWLWDSVYWKPSKSEMDAVFEKSRVPMMQFIPLFNDCDNFALQFLAEVRRKRYRAWGSQILPKEERYPLTLGFVFGTRFRGMEGAHAANVCLTDDGIYIYDTTPNENRSWKADTEDDKILFVFM